ncbi:TasA family protein [Neobacillus niacini]|uniref:TasA family protein n=1 Tax=Neobacillus niacini TaxID=86668 RepID=UPI0020426345|nr:TasA family protein [Neobacillus niacini]MCM3692725.1 LPXTG cell wall anchor domain-containing protein [Neobacillus niacini]
MKRKILFITIFFLLLIPTQSYGEINHNEIDLTTNPGKVLFDLTNMKPGDSVTRNLSIGNNGKQDFNYVASSKFLSGSEIFYNKLDLIVEDKNGPIYQGKLFEFDKLSPRLLKSKQSEKLTFFIKMPMELGNEFQGLECEFQIKLYVEGTLGGILPADGPKLPNTGSDMFNILVVGAVLVLTGSTLQFFIKRRNRLDKQV